MITKEIKNWQMNYKEHSGIACTSPCSMYSVLLENKLMDDPFYGLNEKKACEMSDFPTEFYTTINITEEEYNSKKIELEFLGLDTICEIYLNGKMLGKTMDMHLAYSYDVKDSIKLGENSIRLVFSSPTEYFKLMDKKHYLWVNGDTIEGAAHLRKGLSMSGWDWGPKLPDMGIFRPVNLKFYDYGKITDFFVCQNHSEDKVVLDIDVSVEGEYDEIVVKIDDQEVITKNGKVQIEIENPELWWPNGYGKQSLYDLKIELKKSGKTIDELNKRIGLRTLSISMEKDDDGKEFCFIVNGVKIFAMGANYVPQDNVLSRINPENTRKLLDSCVDANFNCIRIWGGGYYPDEYFYDICDEYGLIIWQDFMFACCNVWLRKEFKELVEKEVIYNVKRIRHHASLGLLCGNNEMEDGVQNWGIGNDFVKMDYLELYERMMPDICEELAPQTFYWPSSPSCGGGFETPNKEEEGDVHYWAVWHGSMPFTDYRKYRFRFCSEYGFESFPNMKTIKSFCEEKDLNPFSEVMENHQKCKGGNTKILTYLSNTYLYATSFDKLVYASQLVQADAIKYGVEYFRRIRGCCMGSIYWQFNDCWPVASWSSVDYYGRYKALHYAAKKFYAPVLTALFCEKNMMTICVANEKMDATNGRIKYGVYDSDFNKLLADEVNYNVNSLTTNDIVSVDVSAYKERKDVFFVADTYDENNNFIMRQTFIFTEPKHFEWKKPDINADIKRIEDKIEIHVTSDVYAKSVEIDFEDCDLILSDNYFDITDKSGYVITAESDADVEKLKASLKITSVYDIR